MCLYYMYCVSQKKKFIVYSYTVASLYKTQFYGSTSTDMNRMFVMLLTKDALIHACTFDLWAQQLVWWL
jgi:hypothetical protein